MTSLFEHGNVRGKWAKQKHQWKLNNFGTKMFLLFSWRTSMVHFSFFLFSFFLYITKKMHTHFLFIPKGAIDTWNLNCCCTSQRGKYRKLTISDKLECRTSHVAYPENGNAYPICRILTKILKIRVKMLYSRKSWEFYYTFLLRLCKKLESESKSWSKILQFWSYWELWESKHMDDSSCRHWYKRKL